jgi:hypothetical protein
MVKSATDLLKLPPTATGFVLPLCASVFKLTSAIYWVVGALFIAKLYGIDLSTANLALVAAVGGRKGVRGRYRVRRRSRTRGPPRGGTAERGAQIARIGVS